MYQKLPDDPWFEKIDPIMKVYLYEHWIRDQEEHYDLIKNQAILTGSFHNPEAAKAMLKTTHDFESSDDDLKASERIVLEDRKKYLDGQENSPRRRRRRTVVKN